jgi:hypothetical protein
MRCTPPVAVGAHDLALGYLIHDALPAAIAEALRDRECLIAEVIELED